MFIIPMSLAKYSFVIQSSLKKTKPSVKELYFVVFVVFVAGSELERR